jgi:hypothetical protein
MVCHRGMLSTSQSSFGFKGGCAEGMSREALKLIRLFGVSHIYAT